MGWNTSFRTASDYYACVEFSRPSVLYPSQTSQNLASTHSYRTEFLRYKNNVLYITLKAEVASFEDLFIHASLTDNRGDHVCSVIRRL